MNEWAGSTFELCTFQPESRKRSNGDDDYQQSIVMVSSKRPCTSGLDARSKSGQYTSPYLQLPTTPYSASDVSPTSTSPGSITAQSSPMDLSDISPAEADDVDMMVTPQGEGTWDTCFGMIVAQGFGDARANLKDKSEVTLSFNGDAAVLNTPQLRNIGLLEIKTSKTITELRRKYPLNFEAMICRKRRRGAQSQDIEVKVVIYGRSADQGAVGDFLSRQKVYLQHPYAYDHSFPYANPHYLYAPGEVIDLPDSGKACTKNRPTSKMMSEVIDLFTTSGTGLNFNLSAILQDINIYSKALTPLKDHQLVGVSFMCEMESREPIMGVPKSWTSDHGSNMSSHEIHRSIYRASLGGLLADDMGLGKTLTTLSLISLSKSKFSGDSDRCPTLVVTPLSTLNEWERQISAHFPRDSLSTYRYYGAQRQCTHQQLMSHDIILTTYDTLVTDSRLKTNERLTKINWHRVVLDEAHYIKEKSTARFKAALALNSRHRWCLTGTPVQNNIEDFHSLLAFLRVAPFDDLKTFKKQIITPLAREDPSAIPLLKRLIQSITLRRTQDSIQLGLLPREDRTVTVRLNDRERELYTLVRAQARQLLPSTSEGSRKTASVLQLILRLRQIASHGLELLPPTLRKNLRKARDREFFDLQEETCEICETLIPNDVVNELSNRLLCPHIICTTCSGEESGKRKSAKSRNKVNCPLCFPREGDSEKPAARTKLQCNDYSPSSKVQELLNNLHADRSRKSVIFSSWTTMLDLIELALQSRGLHFRRIDGSMLREQRKNSLNIFRQDPNCTILLATIQSAGVGLDLTAASAVHLLEPTWNPLSAEQAVHRVQRMGQTRQVVTYRYIVEDTIDQHMVKIQEQKMRLVSMSFGKSNSDKNELMKELENLV